GRRVEVGDIRSPSVAITASGCGCGRSVPLTEAANRLAWLSSIEGRAHGRVRRRRAGYGRGRTDRGPGCRRRRSLRRALREVVPRRRDDVSVERRRLAARQPLRTRGRSGRLACRGHPLPAVALARHDPARYGGGLRGRYGRGHRMAREADPTAPEPRPRLSRLPPRTPRRK